MFLGSGKKLSGHEDSSANNDETKEDIISNLPDSLLIQILSLLPSYDVKQTRIVSKRWKNLFAFLPNLSFVRNSYPLMEQVENFHAFVNQTLDIRGCIPVEKLLLKCHDKCDLHCFYDLLCTLVRFKAGVRELELRFPVIFEDRNMNKVIKFCWDHLFKTWDSIVGLTLHGGYVLHVPNNKLIFPCLKKLSLLDIYDMSCESVANLFSGCPVLEELYLKTDLFYDFNISSLSLKRLSISVHQQIMEYKVVINAPKLEYIFISDSAYSSPIEYSMTKPLSLVEADMVGCFGVISQLLPFLSSAKIFKLTPCLPQVRYHARGLNMPIFPNLVKFVTGLGLDFLPVWLYNMPNLEHITFSYWRRPVIVDLNLPEEPPVCLRFKMKEIIVEDKIYVKQEEFTFIRYLLKHSIILEKFRFCARHKKHKRRVQLLSFHCGSEHCQIEFV